MHKYEELKCIGRGSYGSAHLVTERATADRYVIKKIPMELLSEQEKVQSFREVELLSTLKHPNVVEYKESFVEGNVIHIVMAYCDGGDLAGRIRERVAELAEGKDAYFNTKQILDWFVQMAMAIKYLHERRILHRDLKTSNIFLTTENVVKLGDFGIARTLNSTLDQAKTVVGTPYYMSPEVCESKPYSYASDVWSLGCVLYEMCALKHAFDAPNFLILILKIVQTEFTEVPAHVDPEISDILKKLLDKNPERRPSMDQIFAMPYIRSHMQGLIASGGTLKGAAVIRRPHGTPKRRIHVKSGRRSSSESGSRRRAHPPPVSQWAAIAPHDSEDCIISNEDDLQILDASIQEEGHLRIRLPERSTTPEPLVGSPEEMKPSFLSAKPPTSAIRPPSIVKKASPPAAWIEDTGADDSIDDEADHRFQAEAEELMNPNFQNEYSEECIDSLQIYYIPQSKGKPRRNGDSGQRSTRGMGREMPVKPQSAVQPSSHQPAAPLRVRTTFVQSNESRTMNPPSAGVCSRRVWPDHKRNAIDVTLSVDEEIAYDSDRQDDPLNASEGIALSESGILRALELDAESSGDENDDDGDSSNSEYGGEENFYSEHSGYSDDSDFGDENETVYSDDFEDPDAEIIEYANDEFVPEDDAPSVLASSFATTTTSTSTLSSGLERIGIRSPKFAPSPGAGRRGPTEVQWVRNVAQSLLESCDSLSVA
ncbi:hypothetical protein Poli38472_001545 [Pythium oligandrum]|uniref:non-specific serine/threonine protein kinase n=1 Tax=Pythium oligandrum TaxID=41045 RepID=A0A8K1FQG2_PYTOL|nr:hypothetical protein Poli38472_001545 [Pythium oligandrum]|eukprot:TMW69389.1 hypothetical protein Poli38472_001545 [Pythium oligandrum]